MVIWNRSESSHHTEIINHLLFKMLGLYLDAFMIDQIQMSKYCKKVLFKIVTIQVFAKKWKQQQNRT